MDTYSQLELFKATIGHIPHDKYLFHASFTPDLDRRLREKTGLADNESIEGFFGMYNPVSINLIPPINADKPDFDRYFTDMEIPPDAFINHIGVLEIPGSKFHFTRYVSPLRNAKTLKDLEDFPFHCVDRYTGEDMVQAVQNAHKCGKVTSCFCGHMYEDAWQIRGYEQFLMDMVLAPEMCEFILDRIFDKNLKVAVAAAKAGVDVLMSGDDVANQKAMMFAPELWRTFIKYRWAKVYEAARSIKPDIQIWYHSDGNIIDIIPELIEIGVTILNPVQPECLDIVDVKRKYAKRLVFDGTIGTQSTMPFGTPQTVKKVIREMKEALGYDGALILSPTHVLEPEVQIDNILAFVEACKE